MRLNEPNLMASGAVLLGWSIHSLEVASACQAAGSCALLCHVGWMAWLIYMMGARTATSGFRRGGQWPPVCGRVKRHNAATGHGRIRPLHPQAQPRARSLARAHSLGQLAAARRGGPACRRGLCSPQLCGAGMLLRAPEHVLDASAALIAFKVACP